jgi:hypothetical protein
LVIISFKISSDQFQVIRSVFVFLIAQPIAIACAQPIPSVFDAFISGLLTLICTA